MTTEQTLTDTPFVGRGAELEELENLLRQTLAGHTTVAMLAGDGGIGKSRLAEEFAARARHLGTRVLWSHCHQIQGSPPYWPWTQLLRTWLTDGDVKLIGPRGELIGELLPELAAQLPTGAPLPLLSHPDQTRFRLFDTITRLWHRVAAHQPLLLILDDLHQADTDSLKLLDFLLAECHQDRIMVLGSYRDAGLNRDHPLGPLLGELSRRPRFRCLWLKGINRAAVADYLREVVDEPNTSLAELVHSHSEGNPLFIRELAFALQHRASHPLMNGEVHGLPEGIRVVIGQRLAHLSGKTNELLRIAAVMGRQFDLALLLKLSEQDSESVLEALEEARNTGVIAEAQWPGHYEFSHSLIRQTLYHELPVPRRSILHQRIAEELEILHRLDPDAHLPQLSHHYHRALPLGTAEQASHYAQLAGEQAAGLLAHQESSRFFALALETQTQHLESSSQRVCTLLLALGSAQGRAGEMELSLDTFLRAAAQAREIGKGGYLAQAALGYENASWRLAMPGAIAAALLEEALALIDARDPGLEITLLAALCRAQAFCDRTDLADATQQRAIGLARQQNDPKPLFDALVAMVPARWWSDHLPRRP